MPEGDTIFRTAAVLRSVLVGQRVVAARARPGPGLRRVPDLSKVVGATVTSVAARGKYLLIDFDNGLTLRSHMRTAGFDNRLLTRLVREGHVASATEEAVWQHLATLSSYSLRLHRYKDGHIDGIDASSGAVVAALDPGQYNCNSAHANSAPQYFPK